MKIRLNSRNSVKKNNHLIERIKLIRVAKKIRMISLNSVTKK